MDVWSRGAGDYYEEVPKEQAYGTVVPEQEKMNPELWKQENNSLRKQEWQTENCSVMTAEQEKLYIGYSMRLRTVIDRFEVIIRELRVKEQGLEGEKRRKKNDIKAFSWLGMLGLGLWFMAAIFNFLLVSLGSFFGYSAAAASRKLAPIIVLTVLLLMVYTVGVLRKYIRAKKEYREFMKEKRPENSSDIFSTYYEKQRYYIKCISIMEKRQKMYKTILGKLEKGEAITEKEIGLLEGITDDIYRIPELGFTFYEL